MVRTLASPRLEGEAALASVLPLDARYSTVPYNSRTHLIWCSPITLRNVHFDRPVGLGMTPATTTTLCAGNLDNLIRECIRQCCLHRGESSTCRSDDVFQPATAPAVAQLQRAGRACLFHPYGSLVYRNTGSTVVSSIVSVFPIRIVHFHVSSGPYLPLTFTSVSTDPSSVLNPVRSILLRLLGLGV